MRPKIIHTQTYTYTDIHTYIDIHTSIHTYIDIHTNIHTYVHTYLHLYLRKGKLDRWQDAVEDYSISLKITPNNNFKALFNRFICYEKLGQVDIHLFIAYIQSYIVLTYVRTYIHT